MIAIFLPRWQLTNDYIIIVITVLRILRTHRFNRVHSKNRNSSHQSKFNWLLCTVFAGLSIKPVCHKLTIFHFELACSFLFRFSLDSKMHRYKLTINFFPDFYWKLRFLILRLRFSMIKFNAIYTIFIFQIFLLGQDSLNYTA